MTNAYASAHSIKELIAEKTAEIQELNHLSATKRAEIFTIRDLISEIQDKITYLHAHKPDNYSHEITELNKNLTELRNELSHIMEERDQIHKNIRDLNSEIENIRDGKIQGDNDNNKPEDKPKDEPKDEDKPEDKPKDEPKDEHKPKDDYSSDKGTPKIEDKVGQVFEENLRNDGVIETTRTLNADFGPDGKGSIAPNGDFKMLKVFNGSEEPLTSCGEDVHVTKTHDGYIGTAGHKTVFTLTIDPHTGTHTYKQFEPLDHFEGHNPADDVFWLKFGVTITDKDGDHDSAYIVVDVHDDEPVIQDKFGHVNESDLRDGGTIMTTRDMDFDYGADGAGSIKSNGDFKMVKVFGGDAEPLTSCGKHVEVKQTAYGYQGFAGSLLVFTLTIDDANGTYTYKQFEALDHFEGHNPADEVFWLKFGVTITDKDGDTDTAYLIVDIHDDTPTAHNDLNSLSGHSTPGDVIDGLKNGEVADEQGADAHASVTKIRFGDETKTVNEHGKTVINGEFGKLEIEADGDYHYTAFENSSSSQPVKTELYEYSYRFNHLPQNNAAGNIEMIRGTYNEKTDYFEFKMFIKDPHGHNADGFTLVLSDGDNPKGTADELAIIYFDASGHEPVVTIYSYNGQNTQTSFKDGSAAHGIQAPDKILSSLNDPHKFVQIKEHMSNGVRAFTLRLDASVIQDHDPKYGEAQNWDGLSFGPKLGVWLHPVAGLHTQYDHDGFLKEWNPKKVGWYDTTDMHAEYKHVGTEYHHPEPETVNEVDIFEYTLTDKDGDSDEAYLVINQANGTAKSGTKGDDTLYGTDKDDTLYGSDGNDHLYGKAGADTFVFLKGDTGVDTIKDFDKHEGDVIDISTFLEGFDSTSDAISDFVQISKQGHDTVVAVDQDGKGHEFQSQDIVILKDQSLDLTTLLNKEALTV